MFYITKDKEPEELKIFRNNLFAQRKKRYNWDMCPLEVKQAIRRSLVSEQNGLCAYCTRKIDETCNIEHFKARCNNHSKMFEYENMLGVDCKSGLDYRFQGLCEDGRGGKSLTLSPLDRQMVSGIYYLSDGTIKHDKYQNDLDNVLNLNHQIFKQKRVGCLKAFKAQNIPQGNYNFYIDFYKKQPYGGIVVFYLETLKLNPKFIL